MKFGHKAIIAIILPIFSFISLAEGKPDVWFEQDTIHYSGVLSHELNEKLFQIYNENKKVVKIISIESKGGEINLGLELGNFIFDNKLNVKVSSYCLSSCANYIFTAGQTKFVEGDAVIALSWRG